MINARVIIPHKEYNAGRWSIRQTVRQQRQKNEPAAANGIALCNGIVAPEREGERDSGTDPPKGAQ